MKRDMRESVVLPLIAQLKVQSLSGAFVWNILFSRLDTHQLMTQRHSSWKKSGKKLHERRVSTGSKRKKNQLTKMIDYWQKKQINLNYYYWYWKIKVDLFFWLPHPLFRRLSVVQSHCGTNKSWSQLDLLRQTLPVGGLGNFEHVVVVLWTCGPLVYLHYPHIPPAGPLSWTQRFPEAPNKHE